MATPIISIPLLLKTAANQHLLPDEGAVRNATLVKYSCNAVYLAIKETVPERMHISTENKIQSLLTSMGVDSSAMEDVFGDIESPQSARFMLLHLAALVAEEEALK